MTLFENRGLEGPRGTGQRKWESGLAAFPSSTRPLDSDPKGQISLCHMALRKPPVSRPPSPSYLAPLLQPSGGHFQSLTG